MKNQRPLMDSLIRDFVRAVSRALLELIGLPRSADQPLAVVVPTPTLRRRALRSRNHRVIDRRF